jgi:hypothetical protein
MNVGNIACTYVLVQMERRMTRRSDWKLKSAVYRLIVSQMPRMG